MTAQPKPTKKRKTPRTYETRPLAYLCSGCTRQVPGAPRVELSDLHRPLSHVLRLCGDCMTALDELRRSQQNATTDYHVRMDAILSAWVRECRARFQARPISPAPPAAPAPTKGGAP